MMANWAACGAHQCYTVIFRRFLMFRVQMQIGFQNHHVNHPMALTAQSREIT
jgi:hypothetical protein